MVDDAPTPRERALRAFLRRTLRLPRPLLSRLAGPPRRNDRGDSLDLATQLMLRLEGLQPRGVEGREPSLARARLDASCRIVEGAPRPLERVHDLQVGGRPARLYAPLGLASPAPLLVYLHGGGWVVGGLRSHDRLCRRLAADGGQLVLAVDYRLAPEHPFPTPVEDAVDAVRWARHHARDLGADPARVAIGGDSAGGNLSAVACLDLRAAGEPQPSYQLLIYPATDMRRCTASHRALGEGYLLTRASLDWYQGHYAPEVLDPRASPLLAADHRGLAPAVVITAGFDPLRDEGEQYALALEAAGVHVEHLAFRGLVHGFANMDGVLTTADEAVGRVVAACRAMGRRGRAEV